MITIVAAHRNVFDIDVLNYIDVNACYLYFTPILAEIDVTDIFYILPFSYSQKGCFFTCQMFRVY